MEAIEKLAVLDAIGTVLKFLVLHWVVEDNFHFGGCCSGRDPEFLSNEGAGMGYVMFDADHENLGVGEGVLAIKIGLDKIVDEGAAVVQTLTKGHLLNGVRKVHKFAIALNNLLDEEVLKNYRRSACFNFPLLNLLK